MGIRFLPEGDSKYDAVAKDDVVIIPAFGIPASDIALLERKGCVVVDTTCGSVLNVWKNVRRYADDGFTSVIHGKFRHEETRATASQAWGGGRGHYLVVLDKGEAERVCAYIRFGGDAQQFLEEFSHAVSPGFHPDRDLQRVGCANQTTMLSTESVAIGEMFREAMRDRHGETQLGERFRAFDTICSATQDRQDAVIDLLSNHALDLMVVIGGYNSSNTCNLARICAARLPTYHIADPEGLVSATTIRHKPIDAKQEMLSAGWLPEGPLQLGLTSGASTPDNLVETVIRRLDAFANG
jgi:4-hydroxy-3-methylbut-2-enyl diphosphate reductase